MRGLLSLYLNCMQLLPTHGGALLWVCYSLMRSSSNAELWKMTSGEAVVEGGDAIQDAFKIEGNKYFSSGDFVKAVAAYNKAIKADPTNGVLYSNRAAAFIQLGKEAKAIKDADQAIELKPDWAKGYFRKGAALVGLRKWDEATTVLKKASELEPKSREINTMLRETMRKRGCHYDFPKYFVPRSSIPHSQRRSLSRYVFRRQCRGRRQEAPRVKGPQARCQVMLIVDLGDVPINACWIKSLV